MRQGSQREELQPKQKAEGSHPQPRAQQKESELEGAPGSYPQSPPTVSRTLQQGHTLKTSTDSIINWRASVQTQESLGNIFLANHANALVRMANFFFVFLLLCVVLWGFFVVVLLCCHPFLQDALKPLAHRKNHSKQRKKRGLDKDGQLVPSVLKAVSVVPSLSLPTQWPAGD